MAVVVANLIWDQDKFMIRQCPAFLSLTSTRTATFRLSDRNQRLKGSY